MKVPAPPVSYAVQAMEEFMSRREQEMLAGDVLGIWGWRRLLTTTPGWRLGDSRLLISVITEAVEAALAQRIQLDV